MDEKKLNELLEKIKNLKDLRYALVEVKKAGLHKEEPKSTPVPTEEQNVGDIKHLGVNVDDDGNIVHSIGRSKDQPHYQVTVHLDKLDQKKPAYDVHFKHHKTGEITRPTQLFNSIQEVIRHVMMHDKKKRWEV